MEEQIVAELVLKGLEPYTSGLQKASGAAEQAGGAQEEVAKKSKLSASSMVRAAAAAGIVYKGYGLLKGSIDTTVQLAKDTAAFSRVSGLSTKESQSWVLVAKERGLQVKQLQTSMATLGRQLGVLGGKPSKSSIEALQKLGLTQQQLIKLPMEQKMGTLADAFNKLPNGISKAALAQKLMGRTGVSLLPIFQGGSKAMNETIDSASKLVPANAGAGKSALNLVKSQRELEMAMTGVKVSMGTALIPIMNQATQAIQPMAEWFGKLLKIFPPLGPMIVAVAAALAGLLVFDKISSAASGFADAMKAVKDSTLAQAAADKIAAAAQWLWNLAMEANPILLIITALVALGVALVVLYTKVGWFRDLVNGAFNAIKNVVMAVIGWIIGHWKLLAVIIGTIMLGPIAGVVLAFLLLSGKVKTVLNAIKDGFNTVKNFILGVVSAIVGAFTALPKKIIGAITALPGQISRAASGMFDGIKNAISSAANFVSGKVTWILNLIKKVIDAVTSLPSKILSPITSVGSKIGNLASGAAGKVGSFFSGQHGGTMPHPGGLSLVGEAGPEIVALPGGASVIPLAPPATVSHGGRPIVVQTFLEKKMIGQAVADYAGDLQAAR